MPVPLTSWPGAKVPTEASALVTVFEPVERSPVPETVAWSVIGGVSWAPGKPVASNSKRASVRTPLGSTDAFRPAESSPTAEKEVEVMSGGPAAWAGLAVSETASASAAVRPARRRISGWLPRLSMALPRCLALLLLRAFGSDHGLRVEGISVLPVELDVGAPGGAEAVRHFHQPPFAAEELEAEF